MRSFLLGAPIEGSFNIPFKVERGESMETVTCTVTASNMDALKSWAESVGSNIALVNKNDPSRNNMPICMTVCGGNATNAARNRNGTLAIVQFSDAYDADVRSGDVFYVFRPE